MTEIRIDLQRNPKCFGGGTMLFNGDPAVPVADASLYVNTFAGGASETITGERD